MWTHEAFHSAAVLDSCRIPTAPQEWDALPSIAIHSWPIRLFPAASAPAMWTHCRCGEVETPGCPRRRRQARLHEAPSASPTCWTFSAVRNTEFLGKRSFSVGFLGESACSGCCPLSGEGLFVYISLRITENQNDDNVPRCRADLQRGATKMS